jgi:DNA-binding phage protein
MTNEEQEDLTAELLATNQTLVFIVRSIASLAEKEGIPREVFFRT